MEKNIFPNKEVGDFFNKNFVSFKAKLETKKGAEVCGRFNVRGYPTLLFLSADGVEKNRMAGATPNADFCINLAKKAIGQGGGFLKNYQQYLAGNRDMDFIRELISKCLVHLNTVPKNEVDKWQKTLNELTAWYFSIKRPRETVNKKDFSLISVFLGDGNNGNPFVEYVYNNYDAYAKVVPAGDLAGFVVRNNNLSIHDSYGKGNLNWKSYLEDIKGRLSKAYGNGADDTYTIMECVAKCGYCLSARRDVDGFLYWNNKLIDYYKSKGELGAHVYMAAASNVFYKARPYITPKQCKKVIKLIKTGLKLNPNMANLYMTLGDLYLLLNDEKNAHKAFDDLLVSVKGTAGENYYRKQIEKKFEN